MPFSCSHRPLDYSGHGLGGPPGGPSPCPLRDQIALPAPGAKKVSFFASSSGDGMGSGVGQTAACMYITFSSVPAAPTRTNKPGPRLRQPLCCACVLQGRTFCTYAFHGPRLHRASRPYMLGSRTWNEILHVHGESLTLTHTHTCTHAHKAPWSPRLDLI